MAAKPRTNVAFAASVFGLLLLPIGQMAYPFLPAQALFGVQRTAPRPSLRSDGLLRGEFQKGLEAWFNQNYGLHDALVKTDRQLYYSLFRAVHDNEGIVVGRDRQLLSDGYIRATLQYDPPADYSEVAASLARLERALRARGRPLVVLITPSKASTYPQTIPAAYTRIPHHAADGDYRNFVDALRRSRVSFVDAKKIVAELAAAGPHRVFPRGGIHWNEHAATVAAQALLEQLERSSGRRIGRIAVDGIDYDRKPSESDADYAGLLNVWAPPLDFEGVHVRRRAVPGAWFGRLSLVLEGDSFLDHLFGVYSRLGLFKRITYIAYNRRFLESPGRAGDWRDIGRLDREARVVKSDAIVVEVNDAIISRSNDPAAFAGGFVKDLSTRLGLGL